MLQLQFCGVRGVYGFFRLRQMANSSGLWRLAIYHRNPIEEIYFGDGGWGTEIVPKRRTTVTKKQPYACEKLIRITPFFSEVPATYRVEI